MSSVRLSWVATAGATFYRVYGSNDGLNFSLLADNITGLTYTHDAGHTQRWWYRITSCNDQWESRPSTAVAPANWPPTWPAPFSLTGTAGQQINVSGYAADRDSPTKTFAIVAPIPSGYSMTTAGMLTLGTASSNLTLSVSDGTLTATTTVAVTVSAVPAGEPLYPRLSVYGIGDSQSFPVSVQQWMAKFHFVILGGDWQEWQSATGKTKESVVAGIKSYSTVGTKVFQYLCMNEGALTGYYRYTAWMDKVKATSWWCYQSGASGSITLSNWSADWGMVNFTRAAPASGGLYPYQWAAKYANDYFHLGNYATYGGVAYAAVPSLDGFCLDNVFWFPRTRTAADWNRDGSADSSDNETVRLAFRTGQKDWFDKLAELWPTGLQIGNIADWGAANSLTPLSGVPHGGVYEHAIGLSFSDEAAGTLLYERYPKIMAAVKAPKLVGFSHTDVSQNGTDYYDPEPYRAARYGLCLCTVLGDAYYSPHRDYYEATLNWFEEFDGAGAGVGYLGTPVDGPQTAAWSNGVYRRRFANGWVLMNPRWATTKTVELGQPMRRISGSQPYNTGGTVTSVTLQPRDGIILLNPPPASASAWPTQSLTYLPAVRNRAGFAMGTRHAFTGGVTPTIYRVVGATATARWDTALTAVGDGSYRGGLKQALLASGNRIVVFETSGSIDLGNPQWGWNISNGNLWIAGQTAPNPGVTLVNGNLVFLCSNVLMQHMRVHMTTTWDVDCATVHGESATRSGVVFDHCEFAYARDEIMDLYKDVASFDLIESMLTWPLYNGSTAIGSAMLARYGPAGNSFSIQGCYFAHNQQRNPFTTKQNVLVANNIFYDYGDMALAKEPGIPTYTNVIGNRMKSNMYGPISLYPTAVSGCGYGNASTSSTAYDGATKLWLSGNTKNGVLIADQSALPTSMVNNGSGVTPTSQFVASAQLSAATPTGWVGWSNIAAMETHILTYCGARPRNRNQCATEAIADYTSGATGRISSPNYPDTNLAYNTATFNKDAAGAAFSASGEGYGGTFRPNVEVHLLNLGEAV